ncbi:hypothetical protein DFH29DRAFT_1005326 [Suillus ampliporus]|nr:hypothetical protein DFH29DRAFT_1005326 [Suillus ampliporus]
MALSGPVYCDRSCPAVVLPLSGARGPPLPALTQQPPTPTYLMPGRFAVPSGTTICPGDPQHTGRTSKTTSVQSSRSSPTDNILFTAKTKDDASQLEIYVYDESQDNLYVHHDIMLPNFPLCLEWLDFPPTEIQADAPPKFSNYIASLDVTESMYPDMVLGRPDKTAAHVPVPSGMGQKKHKKTKHRPSSDAYHIDAVPGISWNRTYRHMLTSASADRTISSFGVHKDKVQAVQWNEKELTVLLSKSYDRTVQVFDSQALDTGIGAVLGADVEALRWDPWGTHAFYVLLENGHMLNFDTRTLPTHLNSSSPARFVLSAHDSAVSALYVGHVRKDAKAPSRAQWLSDGHGAGHADDMLHKPLPCYNVPHYIGSTILCVMPDVPVDIVFLNYFAKKMVSILNTLQKDRNYPIHDALPYSPL